MQIHVYSWKLGMLGTEVFQIYMIDWHYEVWVRVNLVSSELVNSLLEVPSF